MFDEEYTTTIAETACTHEGNLDELRELVDKVGETEADLIKFHVFTAEGRAVPETNYYQVCSNLEIPPEEWSSIISRASSHGLKVTADVFDMGSAELLDEIGIDAFKIHAADLNNEQLIRRIASIGKPTILYVGGATKLEIQEALEHIRSEGNQDVGLLYGLQTYPTSFGEANLGKISALKSEFELPVGYASHLPGGSPQALELPALAVTAGASFIECHVTLDRTSKRVDYISSLHPDEFDEMIARVRKAEVAVGETSLALTDAEKEYRQSVRKTPHTIQELEAGHVLSREDLAYLRGDSEPSFNPINMEQLIGKQVNQPIEKYTPVNMSQIDSKTAAVLACRSESTRLYGKPLQLIGDKSILARIIEGLQTVPNIDEIVLAIADTPSQASFIDVANQYDLPYVIGPEIDVLSRCVMAAQEVDADFVVKANTENPFVAYGLVEDAIDIIQRKNADFVVLKNLPLGSAVDTVSMQALERSQEYGDERHKSEFTSRFIIENSESFAIESVTPDSELQRPDIRLTVDYPSDLILIREIWSGLGSEFEGGYIELRDILEFLDDNPDIKGINGDKIDGTNDSIKAERPYSYGGTDP